MFDGGEEHVSSRWGGHARASSPLARSAVLKGGVASGTSGSEMGAGLYVGNRLHSQTGESRRQKEQREKD